MDVSIIIVNYNTKELTKQCLKSVFEKTQDIDFEIIVMDNASHDGSQQMLKSEFPNVTLVESAENLGFGRANNWGAQYAKGKYLFLLNSDTILLNNVIKVLADFLDKNQNIGICGGNLYDETRQPTLSYSVFLPSILSELNDLFSQILGKIRYGKNIFFNYSNKPVAVGYVSGADLMIRTDLFKQINGFDSDFFMYYEEAELTFRIKKMGYTVYSVPQAEIIHLESKSVTDNENKIRMILNSRRIYYKKTYPRTIFLANILFLFTIMSRYLVSKIRNDAAKLRYWKYFIKNI